MVNYITFKQTTSKIYTDFIPTSNGCHIDLLPVGETNNWECIDDPINNHDGDTTYVHSSVTNLQYDLYTIPNHTTENDIPNTINHVKICSKAKSHIYPQHENGIFKLILTDNSCINVYKSNDKELTIDYIMHNNIWVENPRTSAAWTWDDIDNLQIGLEQSSPSINLPRTTTFRPNAVGDITQLTPDPVVPNWQNVDEAIKDNMTTIVKITAGDTLYDLYNLSNHTTETGVISKIVVYAWVYTDSNTNKIASTVIKIGGNTYYDENNLTRGVWTLISTEYAINPATSLAWTWTDIDNLQAGIKLKYTVGYPMFCTQVYVEVYSLEPESLDIRTTQCYAEVNYSIHYNMIAPENVSTDHAQNIREMNMWNGERIVFGESRSEWSLLLKGRDWENDACDKILNIKQLGLDGLPIILTGLNNINWDTEWMIKSLGWRLVSEKPLHYEWIILLEKT